MPDRIVVCFRGTVPPGGEKSYLDRALALKQRAEAHGATLCAWSALTFSFDFDPDELEEAASLAALAQENVPEDERLCAGIAVGETYQRAGFDAVLSERVSGDFLTDLLDFVDPAPVHLVMLRGARTETDGATLGSTDLSDGGLLLDLGDDPPQEVARIVLARLDEGLIG